MWAGSLEPGDLQANQHAKCRQHQTLPPREPETCADHRSSGSYAAPCTVQPQGKKHRPPKGPVISRVLSNVPSTKKGAARASRPIAFTISSTSNLEIGLETNPEETPDHTVHVHGWIERHERATVGLSVDRCLRVEHVVNGTHDRHVVDKPGKPVRRRQVGGGEGLHATELAVEIVDGLSRKSRRPVECPCASALRTAGGTGIDDLERADPVRADRNIEWAAGQRECTVEAITLIARVA